MNNTPTYWKILKITKGDYIVYKVLAHWLGDLQFHDTAWKLNSGITKVEFDQDQNQYKVHGKSGSIYLCSAVGEHISGYMLTLLEGFEYKLNQECSDVFIEPISMEDYLNEQHSA